MRSIRFGIDIDGTVTTPTALLPHINKHFGSSLTLDDIKEYDLTKAFDVDPIQFGQWYKETEELIYQTSPAQEFAKEVLTNWQKQFELYYISARGQNVLESTTNWFHEQQIPYDHVELIGTHYKIEAAKQFNVDVFFEDKHDNAVGIHEELDIPVFLFDTPYNQDPIPEGVIRVANWKQADQYVRQLFHVTEMIKNK
ncbi:hypothetical protein [Sporosarcina sp. P1]|uniref:5' nucleotidase, NT5C type n=1 Tax=Sporosarcina sp. P1 TaxID=2048257 RepID=UPI000C167E92|nr:hypothetical protein [Sporosarcina sp. P1]PIC84762.1 hypothetical protein CSV73_02390 [Sporosarcina sp. P1]